MTSDTRAHIASYLHEAAEICSKLPQETIGKIVEGLASLRAQGGRLFFLGVGGSAANASHAVNDFRKIANIEAYTPTDNAAELTARVNDEGWDTSYAKWLRVSKIGAKDAVFVLSVGGGDAERKVSVNLIEAIRTAREAGAKVYAIAGRDGGYAAKSADACVVIPPLNPATVTPHTEAFQAVILHLIVSHPMLLANAMKWESIR
ncbi:MAG TPA: SIS domain-containing protein [Candidatus Binataceae bacterium]|nr:SIS domain-containing protein [Candidatus Binataceae bacterium]